MTKRQPKPEKKISNNLFRKQARMIRATACRPFIRIKTGETKADRSYWTKRTTGRGRVVKIARQSENLPPSNFRRKR
jgi:hypothetical protein